MEVVEVAALITVVMPLSVNSFATPAAVEVSKKLSLLNLNLPVITSGNSTLLNHPPTSATVKAGVSNMAQDLPKVSSDKIPYDSEMLVVPNL